MNHAVSSKALEFVLHGYWLRDCTFYQYESKILKCYTDNKIIAHFINKSFIFQIKYTDVLPIIKLL